MGFQWRTIHPINGIRVVLAVILVAETPLAAPLPAWAALGSLTLTCVVWIAAEVWRYGDVRREIRESVHAPH